MLDIVKEIDSVSRNKKDISEGFCYFVVSLTGLSDRVTIQVSKNYTKKNCEIENMTVNPFPDYKYLTSSKLKVFADGKINVT